MTQAFVVQFILENHCATKYNDFTVIIQNLFNQKVYCKALLENYRLDCKVITLPNGATAFSYHCILLIHRNEPLNRIEPRKSRGFHRRFL